MPRIFIQHGDDAGHVDKEPDGSVARGFIDVAANSQLVHQDHEDHEDLRDDHGLHHLDALRLHLRVHHHCHGDEEDANQGSGHPQIKDSVKGQQASTPHLPTNSHPVLHRGQFLPILGLRYCLAGCLGGIHNVLCWGDLGND